jgi:hypothetical protein
LARTKQLRETLINPFTKGLPMPYPRIILVLAQAYRKLCCVNGFERAAKDPMRYQERLLLDMVRKNKDTKFGRAHFFESIRTIEDFQKNVPIRRYEGFLDYIEEIKHGKQGILTREDVILFGMTSGTTGKPKYCPITREFEADNRKNWEIWQHYSYRDHPGIYDGKVFVMVSREIEGYTPGGVPYGSVSGMIANHLSRFVRNIYVLPYVVWDIKDYEARYYAILRIAIEEKVTLIVTPNPSMLLLLARKALHYRDRIIKDIEKGTITGFEIDTSIREALASRLKPNPHRAAELRKGSFTPADYWPRLSLIGTWKEGTLSHYIKQLPKYYNQVPLRDIGLISTEGHSTIPLQDEGGQGILAVTTHFFEFMPVGHKTYLTCDKLEEGKEYFLIITTSAGLYRYHTNDIVKVVGFWKRTPIIEFLHKGEHVTSITGEKLTEWQVVNAVRMASHGHFFTLDGFTAVANTRASRYDFLMEFHQKPRDMEGFTSSIDNAMKQLNIEYREKRNSGRLKRPVIRMIRPGSYHALHKAKSEKGHDAQVKIPALTDDVKFEKSLQWK